MFIQHSTGKTVNEIVNQTIHTVDALVAGYPYLHCRLREVKPDTKPDTNRNGRHCASRNSLILVVSRAGLEPATHWLKAS